MEKNYSLRDTSKDTLKGWLILDIVLGHFIETTDYLVNLTLITPLWSFQMPLFALISGYFTRRKNNDIFNKQTIIHFSYFLIAHILLSLLFPQGFKGWLCPAFGTWYLLSFIFWRCFIQFCEPKLFNNKLYTLGLLFFISICIGFVPISKVVSFQRTFSFLPFFYLGYCLQTLKMRIGQLSNKVSISIIIIGLALSFGFKLPIFYGSIILYSYQDALIKCCQEFSATMICLGIFNLSKFTIPILSLIGQKTLWIYLGHLPIVLIFRYWL